MSRTVASLTRAELEAEVLRLRGQQSSPSQRATEVGHAASNHRAALTDADALFSAVEKTGLPMILTDPNRADDPIVFANRAFLDLTGYESHEVIGCNCRLLQGPETEPERLAELRAALAENRDCTVELTNHRRDGSTFVNALFVGPVFGPDGQLRYRFGSQLDVTEMHRNRRRLAESEERQRAIFNSAVEMAIMATDCEGRITDWNSGAERILGWSAQEMRGQTIHRIFTPEDRAAGCPADEMRRALAEGHAEDERWHLRKDRSRFYASGDMTPLLGAGGEHRGFVKALSDRTARREAEARLASSERRYRGLFEAIDTGFCLFEMRYDEDGRPVDYRFLEANPAFERHTGFADVEGRWMRDLAPGHEQFWFDGYGAVARTGEPRRFEARAEALGRDYEIFAFRVDEPDRHLVAALFSDVTERKSSERRQAALVELGERLRALDAVPPMVEATLDVIADALKPDRVGLARLAGGGMADVVDCRTTRHLPDIAGRHDLADYGAVRGSVEAARLMVIADVRHDPRTAGDAAALSRLGIAALVTIPVYEHGQAVEMIFVHGSSPRAWTKDDIAFLRTAADRLQVGMGRARAEEQQRLRNHELSHRMKNMLAMVQSVATQTMRSASDVGSARDLLSGRLVALSKAHDLLMGGTLAHTGLCEVVRCALAVHEDGDRFEVTGADEEIGADQAMSLSLMLHELATNAAKYGALSNEAGRVAVTWRRLPEDGRTLLCLTWRERGGPLVEPPTRKGFGSRFVARALALQVGGEITLDYPREGVTCTLTAPLAAFQAVRRSGA